MTETGHWHCETNFHVGDYEGFVYKITVRGKWYIGAKSFWTRRKGKPDKESNWRTYTSSSRKMNELLKENFGKGRFEMLFLCETKSALRFVEIQSLIFSRAITHEDCLNVLIPGLRSKVKGLWRKT